MIVYFEKSLITCYRTVCLIVPPYIQAKVMDGSLNMDTNHSAFFPMFNDHKEAAGQLSALTLPIKYIDWFKDI